MLIVPPLRIGVFDRDRNPLAFFVDAKNDELSRLLFARDPGRFDDESFDPRRKKFGVDDFEHRRSEEGNDESPTG